MNKNETIEKEKLKTPTRSTPHISSIYTAFVAYNHSQKVWIGFESIVQDVVYITGKQFTVTLKDHYLSESN